MRFFKPGLLAAVVLMSWIFLPIAAFSQTAEKTIDLPVYEDFDQLEHIFQFQNDTTYIINFWATWCKPCVEEMPFIEQLHETFEGEKIRVFLVSLDFPSQIESKLIPFMEANQLKSEVAVLTDMKYNDWIDRVDPRWGGAIPVTLFYRGDKRIFVNEPFHSAEEVEKIVRELLD